MQYCAIAVTPRLLRLLEDGEEGTVRIGVTSLSSDHLISVLSTPRTTPQHNFRRKRSKLESVKLKVDSMIPIKC